MMKRGIAAVALTMGALGLGAFGPGIGMANADPAAPLAPIDSDSGGGDFSWLDYANPDSIAELGDLGSLEDLRSLDLSNVGRLGELANVGDLGDLSSLSDLDGNLASISDLAGLVHAGG